MCDLSPNFRTRHRLGVVGVLHMDDGGDMRAHGHGGVGWRCTGGVAFCS
jgi:hypothetical protein